MDAALTASACWGFAAQLPSLWWTDTRDAHLIRRLQGLRLDALLHHARQHSPVYARLYRGLPEPLRAQDLVTLPVVHRPMLMRHFDQWVTDRRITLRDVKRFVADPQLVGERYRGRYVVWTSSGSTGEPGIYVQDEHAMAVYEALGVMRAAGTGLARWPPSPAGSGPRVLITATGGHFAGVASWTQARRAYPWMAPGMRTLSVLQPLDQTVAQLNEWQPSELAGYPSALALLAQEQHAGRLRLQTRALWSGGENLDPEVRARITRAFNCPLFDAYGASECLTMAFECSHGQLHLNEDWVVLEPVDAWGRCVPRGQASHSVLLTNLANHVQPLIRYDLGDRITLLPPCPCGSAMAALRVDGRSDDTVRLRRHDGAWVSLLPLALATVIEERAGEHRFQLRQTGPRSLSVSLESGSRQRLRSAGERVRSALSQHLAHHDLPGIRITLSKRPLQPDPQTGKLRRVIGLSLRRASPRHGEPVAHSKGHEPG